MPVKNLKVFALTVHRFVTISESGRWHAESNRSESLKLGLLDGSTGFESEGGSIRIKAF